MANPLAALSLRAASRIPLGQSGSPNGRRKLARPALGNLKNPYAGSGSVMAGTQAVTYTSEGQPLSLDWSAEELAREAYLGQVYVQRGCKLIAETIAQLPWVAGPDATDPSNYDKDASLAMLLGPHTPQAPGGPNPQTPARIFWAWSIIQYIVTGRFAWEVEYDPTQKGPQQKRNIIGLWPLVSAALAPIPTTQGTNWFSGFQYTPALGQINLPAHKVIYNWRPSITDWRMPESILQSSSYPVYIANAVNKYMANFLKNGLVATTLIATPPIEEPENRRAWQDQFLGKFTGVQNAGSTYFAEIEYDEDENTGKPLVQIEKLATTPVDASLMQMLEVAKEDICIGLGVPKSMMAIASESTFANSDAEWRNFWTTTLLNLIEDIQDQINLRLASRLDGGANMGWFDLSKVEALQPPAIFTPPMITDVIQTGVATPEQVAAIMGIPPQEGDPDAVTDSDTDTINRALWTPDRQRAEELSGMSERDRMWVRWQAERALYHHMRREPVVNTHTLRGNGKRGLELRREHITVTTKKPLAKRTPSNPQATRLLEAAKELRATAESFEVPDTLDLDDATAAELDALGDELTGVA